MDLDWNRPGGQGDRRAYNRGDGSGAGARRRCSEERISLGVRRSDGTRIGERLSGDLRKNASSLAKSRLKDGRFDVKACPDEMDAFTSDRTCRAILRRAAPRAFSFGDGMPASSSST